jgi:hypothetical protein
MVDENSAAGKAGVNAKEDWFLTRVTARISALKSFLMSMVLTDLANLNQKKITGKTLKYKNSFQIVTALKLKCALTKHTTTLKSFAFQLGQYQRSQTGHELIRRDALRMDVTTRFNMAGTLKTGDDWTAPTKITEKTFLQLKLKIDADGKSRML